MSILTPDEAAELLKLSTRQTLRLVSRNEVPHFRLPNGEIRFDSDDLRQWLHTLKRPLDELQPLGTVK